jgi:hypothetical protein
MKMAIVYLIGVDHLIQHTKHMTLTKKRSVQRFTDYLREQVASRNITAIAEEFSEEALQKSGVGVQSTLQPLAKQLHICHRFCDPDTDERERLGVNNDPKRERVWLERIQELKSSTTLFICGSNHLETFKTLLQESGTKTEILSDGWGSELNSLKRCLGVRF